ncbi:immunity protein Imm33 domain-containing protein (plasmid) [Agrobacterium sp. rho-13.3]|uniref:immunity protein Imm33 domain-containing protein n=1 Tax=Agrobacterium sp. rho-13.3 TaxID=3072980 RepID=UPI002A16E925|nr:hypothetical protein [Agrobacterium sp. rho-13.3]MDX8310146.1 hypothetical protein [Agrobacterium sp. rho-13.3]
MRNTIDDEQSEICKKHNCSPLAFDPAMHVGVNLDSLSHQPIYGVRVRPTDDTSGWYFWGGEYSDDDGFFYSVHGFHVLERLPELGKYLALPPGYKFILDDEGYEDVWYDTSSFARAGQKP